MTNPSRQTSGALPSAPDALPVDALCAPPVTTPAPQSARGTLIIDSAQLFAGATELQIEHRGARYRLRRTALGKLILTK